MPRWIAFLRAINVGGHVVKMNDLRSIFESMGFEDVKTFIQTGNVLFDSKDRKSAALEARIEAALKTALGYESSTYIRSIPELQNIAKDTPYTPDEVGEAETLQVGFFREKFSKESCELISKLASDSHGFRFGEREVFWLVRGRFADYPLKGDLAARKLIARGTFRNIKMLRRLAAKCE